MNDILRESLDYALESIGIASRKVNRIVSVSDWAKGQRYRVFVPKYKRFGLLVFWEGDNVVTIRDENMKALYEN